MSKEVLLRVKDLRVRLKATGALLFQGVDLELHAEQRLTLIGESGSGKSIFAQAIIGILPDALQVSGCVEIAGHRTDGQRSRTQPLWGSTVVMLPQEPWSTLNPLMRILPQVAEGAHYVKRASWPQARAEALAGLKQLGVDHAAHQYLHQISGGMAQRVGVVAAGMGGARLLLADEPTKGLDEDSREQVAQLLAAAQGRGQALLTITHDLDLARQLGGTLMVVQRGNVVEMGDAEQVLTNPQHEYTRALVGAMPAKWSPLVQPLKPKNGAAVIQGRGLSKRYAARRLFDDVDISIAPGEVVSVSGHSGCGKTTLGNILLGVKGADRGEVVRAPVPRWKFGKLYQDPLAAFPPQRRLRDALNDVVRLHGLNGSRIGGLMQELSLRPELLDRLPSEVSGGELQRIALMRLLLLEPAFIFADEPTSRLDLITQQDTMRLICRATQQHGCAVLLVSHDPWLARASSHRQIMLARH